MMYENKKALLKKAIIEALSEKYEAELSLCRENTECSQAHRRNMKRILCGGRIISQKAIIAIIVAAAILLTGCTAIYVYRDEIGGMFFNIYDTWVRITGEEKVAENNSSITEFYRLTYVPDGYELKYEHKTPIGMRYHYKSSADPDNYGITFSQEPLNSIIGLHNTKDSYTLEHGGITLYVHISNDLKTYVWKYEGFLCDISTPSHIEEAEVLKMIDGIVISE